MQQNSMCALHEKTLDLIMAKLDTLATHQATTTESIAGLRREMETGFKAVHRRQDITNGRIDKNEAAVGKLASDMAAQDYFSVASTRDRTEIWAALEREIVDRQAALAVERDARVAADELARREVDQIASKSDHDDGFAAGAAKAGHVLWVLLVAVIAVIGWLISLWMAHGPKG